MTENLYLITVDVDPFANEAVELASNKAANWEGLANDVRHKASLKNLIYEEQTAKRKVKSTGQGLIILDQSEAAVLAP
jgi:hypothetical protein